MHMLYHYPILKLTLESTKCQNLQIITVLGTFLTEPQKTHHLRCHLVIAHLMTQYLRSHQTPGVHSTFNDAIPQKFRLAIPQMSTHVYMFTALQITAHKGKGLPDM